VSGPASEALPTIQEGTRVRSLKSNYRHLGVGRVLKVRNDLCKAEFKPTVFSHPSQRSINYLLYLAELEVCPSPLDLALQGRWDDAGKFDLRQMAARFLTLNKGGQLSNARTEILPHQIFTAHTVVSNVRRRFMLADEVGLGKTIEAGMVWQALYQRGSANRTLIISPAGLTRQWQEEFRDKFQAVFEIFGRDFTGTNPQTWSLRAQAIASLDTLKRKEHKRILLENCPWDLIIFDEAHRLSAREYGQKTEKTQNYQLAEALRDYTDAMLLLTATPHAGDPDHSRFVNLVRLLEPSVDFSPLLRRTHAAGSGPPYTQLVLRTPKLKVTDAQGKAVFKGRRTQALAFSMYPDEREFYAAVEDYIRTGYYSLEQVDDPMHRRAVGFILVTFQKLNASSVSAIKAALAGRLQRLEDKLDKLPAEEDEDECPDERFQGELEEKAVLQSPRAMLRNEAQVLKKLLAIPVTREKKADRLRDLLRHVDRETPGAKVLIFTEYRRTQEFLRQRLETWYGPDSVVLINGDMELEGKTSGAESKRRSQSLFRDAPEVRFLVSTEAGGEGINLQFCYIVVNYDLPWNPMRYEQRIGRVYRYGQEKVVQIYNLRAKDTVEDTVRSYFEQRLRAAAEALGAVTGEDPEELVASLNGQLEGEIEPEEIYRRALVDGTLNTQTKEEIQEAIQRAQKAYEIATQSLFRDVSSYSFDSYQKRLASPVSLADLEEFTLRFLAAERRQVQRRRSHYEFLTPEALRPYRLPERYSQVTFDRATAIRNPQAEFFALGHDFVDAMLDYVGDNSFGGHTALRVLEVPGGGPGEPRLGIQFNFTVRSRVHRQDEDECLFDFHTVVVDTKGAIDSELATRAAQLYSRTAQDPAAARLLEQLEDVSVQQAYECARRHLETQVQIWDWDDDVDLIGVARVVLGRQQR
jgi:superfamily II DNA or RNA helicase